LLPLLVANCSLGNYLLNDFITTIRDLVQWSPDTLRSKYILAAGPREALKECSKAIKARAEKFADNIKFYFQESLDYNNTRVNAKQILNLFEKSFRKEGYIVYVF
jgi:hypothetical protein